MTNRMGDCYGCMTGEHAAHIRVRSETSSADSVVVARGGPRRAYLWVGAREGPVLHVSGAATLRKIARAILDEVGE